MEVRWLDRLATSSANCASSRSAAASMACARRTDGGPSRVPPRRCSSRARRRLRVWRLIRAMRASLFGGPASPRYGHSPRSHAPARAQSETQRARRLSRPRFGGDWSGSGASGGGGWMVGKGGKRTREWGKVFPAKTSCVRSRCARATSRRRTQQRKSTTRRSLLALISLSFFPPDSCCAVCVWDELCCQGQNDPSPCPGPIPRSFAQTASRSKARRGARGPRRRSEWGRNRRCDRARRSARASIVRRQRGRGRRGARGGGRAGAGGRARARIAGGGAVTGRNSDRGGRA